MKRLLTAAGAALVLMSASAGHAQTAAPPAAASNQALSRHDQLAAELAQILFEAVDLDSVLRSKMPEMTAAMSSEKWFRPEWRPLLIEAMFEELEHDRPKIQLIFGRAIAKNMTEDELEAGRKFMSAAGTKRIMYASAHDLPAPTLTRPERAEIERIAATPAGRGFMQKMEKVDTKSDEALNAFVTELLPGVFRRFGEKAEALEAQQGR